MATKDGRLSYNNSILIDNNKASPYLTKQIFISGFGLDKIEANKNYSIQIDTSLMLNNSFEKLTSVSIINITTGINYSLSINLSPQIIAFTKSGKNILSFTLNFESGKSYTSHQIVLIEEDKNLAAIFERPTGPLCKPTNDLVQSDIPFQGYSESEATNSFADYHIYYHTQSPTATDCERVLRKPIIILDGFDPQDGRKYGEIYSDQLRYSNVLLGDDLRDKGYDVVILNFPKLGSIINSFDNTIPNLQIPTNVKINGTAQTIDKTNRDGGTDYMERNAFILVKLIQQINTTLIANGSSEKLVVIGPSMGGQISRYALAYMEKQQSLGVPNMDHNTRLFLSFDSPNDGANIPIALSANLYFFGYFAGNVDAKKNYDEQLHSVAARQLLIEQYDGLNFNASFHQSFYNGAKNNGLSGSNGYPMNLRKVALLNGNGNSIKTYSEGVEIMNLHGNKSNNLVFIAENNFMPATGQNIRLSKSRIVSQNPITVNNNETTVTNNNARGSMDVVQGSTFDATQEVYNGFSAGLSAEGVTENLFNLKPLHCFIPSISALGFRNTNFNWNDNVINRNLLCNNEINFDGYFIPPTNEEHITLTVENVAWLTQEIDKGQPNCPKICSYVVNGSNNLCIGSDETYTLDVPIPSGCNTIWHTSERYQILSFTNNSVTIRGVSDGPTIVKAQIVNPCGADAIITKAIYVGLPYYSTTYKNGIADGNPVSFYFPSQGNNNTFNSVCLGYNGVPNVYMDAIPYGADNLTWSVPSGLVSAEFRLYNQYGNRAYFGWIFGGANPPGYIQASVSNVCGTYSNIFAFQQVNCGTTGGDPCTTARASNYFTISPNPASSNITIGVANRHAPVECNGLRALNTSNGIVFSTVNIYDNLGTLVKSYNTKNAKSASIQISNLIIGSYLVEIIQDDYIERQHIIVQR